MRNCLSIFIIFIFTVVCSYGQVTHTEWKSKNFPPSQKASFTKAFAAYKEGEKQYKLLIKESNIGYLPSTIWYFQTAYAFNPNHIELNRYMVTLLVMQGRKAELFPYLEKLYDLKADLTPDEMFMLASLLQTKGSFTRAEIIFKQFQRVYGDNDFWNEGRLQNPSKRIEECLTGEEISKQAIHFSTGTNFVKPLNNEVSQLFYNYYYGWNAFGDTKVALLSSIKKKDISSIKKEKTFKLYSDINALVFLLCNDTVIKQTSGKKTLEVNKLNGNFRNAEPYLSNDLKLLYFSSDRPDGYGGYDIWVARFDDDGKLLSVKNAGPSVNDKYDQHSPYFSADGKRFFVSSNGKGTTGGFDILYGNYEPDTVRELKNLGFPINTGYDEKAVIWDITGTKGFINRVQYDSAYYVPFRETGSANEALFIGTGFSSATIGPLSATRYESGVSKSFINHICKLTLKINKSEYVPMEIEIFNLSNGTIFLKENLPDTATTLAYLLPSQHNFGIHIKGQGLVPFTANVSPSDEIFLEKHITAKLKAVRKGASFTLDNIFFSKDYIEMDASSKFEINRIASWLKSHPKIKVEIAVHTDSLSMHSTVIAAGESAAFQIYEQLKAYGIEKKRLDWMFYGSEKPLYSGAENRKNRRIELIITDK